MKRVLITGAGGPMGVNLTRSLKMAPETLFLLGTDCNRYHIPLALTDKTEMVPPATDEARYVSKIRQLADRYRIEIIFPSHPLEVFVLGKHRRSLNVRLFLPDQDVLQRGNDKYSSYLDWNAKGSPVPQTFLLESASDLTFAVAHIAKMPVWVRARGTPGLSMGGRALKCKSEKEAAAWVDYWGGWGEFIVSEYLPGDNMTWASVWDRGNLVTSQGRQRLEYVLPQVSQSGITGAPAVSKTVHDNKLNQVGEQAVRAIDSKPNGTYFVDLKGDESGELRITEINAGRFGTTIHFYTAAGLNFPYVYLKLAFGEDVGALPKYNALKAGIYWVRTLDCGPFLGFEEDFK